MIRKTLSHLAAGTQLSEGEMIEAMTAILGGEATPAQIGAFLMGLRTKGVTVPELTGAARVLRAMSTPIRASGLVSLDRDEINVDEETIVDTCGTGGSGTSTFNVSTTTAFVVAACGVKVAKHGTRAVSSLCGSADVLEALGVELELTATAVEDCLENVGIGFLYAPLLHSAMRFVAGPRKEIGLRTIFNLLGPLTNPAGARRQVLGVYERGLTRILAETLRNLGADRALVVHGEDGMDEITVCGRTFVAELRGGDLSEYELDPRDFGIELARPSEIAGGDARENAQIVRRVLAGEKGPRRDVVLLNAGAALYVAGVSSDIREGVARAAGAIDSGAAL
ncbi:MAG: anthranilate phosphoribosyltransferase, partial [Deltaproteobacteria bacterium]|nr:anthranilate phosphoribosyltransferase [Deltaproteobacteria bacterium]